MFVYLGKFLLGFIDSMIIKEEEPSVVMIKRRRRKTEFEVTNEMKLGFWCFRGLITNNNKLK